MMKIHVTVLAIIEVDPEDYREINDEGEPGPIPNSTEIIKYMKNVKSLDELIDGPFDLELKVIEE